MWYYIISLSVLSLSYLFLVCFNTTDQTHCITNILDNTTSCKPQCSHGEFSLYGMISCVPWLVCDDIYNVESGEIIGKGAVKIVSLGKWKNYTVVVNQLRNPKYRQDFQDGLKNLIEFQPSSRVIQVVGFCEKSNIYLTEYYSFKSTDNFENILEKLNLQNSLKIRLKLCLEYITVIDFLHSHPNGSFVMCDSNDPMKALSQLLVRDDMNLVLNDADALPIADTSQGKPVKCGHRELSGRFVAPEQLWPYETEFDDNLMPGYDEKTDIWKIPDVCKVLLDNVSGSISVMLKLFDINSRCKNDEPASRPSVKQVLEVYKAVYDGL